MQSGRLAVQIDLLYFSIIAAIGDTIALSAAILPNIPVLVYAEGTDLLALVE